RPMVQQRIDPESWCLLNWLDSVVATVDTTRSAVVGHGAGRAPARPVQQNVNFYEQVNELHKLAHLLWGGYSAHLGEYENWQIEYMEAMDTPGY
ncbi:hypothetical protein ACGF14_20025, partial [Streptomyces althioticus]|uniref:hypothetical protein n=1 Tax=Streptomyces althioticus TaxID=83380 RepID=UPI00372363A9